MALFLSACSFNSVFFPVDERPSASVNTDMETVELDSSDGKRVFHYFFNTSQNSKATILVFQGSGSTVANWYKVIRPLIQDGYQIFMMEYRGFGSSEGDATHNSIAIDANAALNYLASRKEVKTKPLLVMGQSYGGQLAIYVTYKNQHLVDGLITEGTFTSFSEEAASFVPWPISSLINLIVSNEYNSLELISAIKTNKLFIHSAEDKVVPFEMAKKLYNKAVGRKNLWVIEGKHVAGLLNNPDTYVSKVNALLQKTHDRKVY
ncbi:alpha/beta hydrolase [Alteromonas sp. ASW11-130]|uniref:alpha/beta hydrolase n=1 Tax=Alteromonas sp. ASW11-130 TaxID=3015775 RepID=UPI002241D475|nr:alpha/beta hydrolase [Alteromonas sp. ASW11-130]MCW8093160.1 alpha/beta hydrolase [Alteromonas sp. ASW11-130]